MLALLWTYAHKELLLVTMELVLLMQPAANQLHAHLILASCVLMDSVLQTVPPAILPQMPALQISLLNVPMVFVYQTPTCVTTILLTLPALLLLSYAQMGLALQKVSAHLLMVALLTLHFDAQLVTALILIL